MDESYNLCDSEKQILDAVLSLELYPQATPEEAEGDLQAGEDMRPTLENLRRRGKLIQEDTFGERGNLLDWNVAFPSLVEARLLQIEAGLYTLTAAGRVQARLARTARFGAMFSDYFRRLSVSKAHAEFCQRVFGVNLCQADLMDMDQLGVLLDALDLSEKNRVLDLACGLGRVAEFISDTTGAHVTGVDIATDAIALAQERTRKKRHRLEFRYGDMNNLDLQPGCFDTIIAIAALHFAKDMAQTVQQLVNLLTPDGQMGLFTFQYGSDGDPPESLLPENTNLAQALKPFPIDYRTWDFTQKEIDVRRKQVQIATDLKEAYRLEGNLDLCEDRIEECEIDLPRLEGGTKRRYLFHVRLRKV